MTDYGDYSMLRGSNARYIAMMVTASLRKYRYNVLLELNYFTRLSSEWASRYPCRLFCYGVIFGSGYCILPE